MSDFSSYDSDTHVSLLPPYGGGDRRNSLCADDPDAESGAGALEQAMEATVGMAAVSSAVAPTSYANFLGEVADPLDLSTFDMDL